MPTYNHNQMYKRSSSGKIYYITNVMVNILKKQTTKISNYVPTLSIWDKGIFDTFSSLCLWYNVCFLHCMFHPLCNCNIVYLIHFHHCPRLTEEMKGYLIHSHFNIHPNLCYDFHFLDAIASPSSYPCQSVSEWVSHW